MATISNVYVPQQTTATVSHGTESLSSPTGLAPRPLPTSHNYIRPVKQRGGIGASIRDAVSRATSKAQRSWNEGTDERFRRYFGFPFSEQLYGEWWGDVWTGGQLVPCSCYISTNYLCILYKKKDAVTKDKVHIKATLALRDITCLQKAVCLPAAGGGTPIIQALSDPSVRADALIAYTCDGKMHQFCNFFNFETFLHTLEWNWRTIKAGGRPDPIPQTSGLTPNPNQAAMQQQTYSTTGFNSDPANPTLVKQTTTTTTALPHAP